MYISLSLSLSLSLSFSLSLSVSPPPSPLCLSFSQSLSLSFSLSTSTYANTHTHTRIHTEICTHTHSLINIWTGTHTHTHTLPLTCTQTYSHITVIHIYSMYTGHIQNNQEQLKRTWLTVWCVCLQAESPHGHHQLQPAEPATWPHLLRLILQHHHHHHPSLCPHHHPCLCPHPGPHHHLSCLCHLYLPTPHLHRLPPSFVVLYSTLSCDDHPEHREFCWGDEALCSLSSSVGHLRPWSLADTCSRHPLWRGAAELPGRDGSANVRLRRHRATGKVS